MSKDQQQFVSHCRFLLEAYQTGLLGQTIMPEDSNPGFSKSEKEFRLAYFTLPMALNYQRDSYKLWEVALNTYNDLETKDVFDISITSQMSEEQLRSKLLKYKLALQPNKHINTWKQISLTIYQNWGSIDNMFQDSDYDFIKLRQNIQVDYKKDFPYLSGPKIFNYWCFIIQKYGHIELANSNLIEVAPDTHITKCSVRLGLISEQEANTLSKEDISKRWRIALEGSDINPVDMHAPLWFWSRNGFLYDLEDSK